MRFRHILKYRNTAQWKQFQSGEHTESPVISSGWLQRWVSSDVINGSSVWRTAGALTGFWQATDSQWRGDGMRQINNDLEGRESKGADAREKQKKGKCVCMCVWSYQQTLKFGYMKIRQWNPHIYVHTHSRDLAALLGILGNPGGMLSRL